jgi:hypothetical protein
VAKFGFSPSRSIINQSSKNNALKSKNMATVEIKLSNDQIIEMINEIKEELSIADKKRILNILFKGRGYTDAVKLWAEIADVVYNG